MSALLRLYPQAWQERYGDEMLALLEERPASLSDRIDLIRGGLDARLHPQVPGSAGLVAPQAPLNQGELGAVAAIGGIAWIIGVASMFVLPRGVDGYRDLGLTTIGVALAVAFIGIALGELGTREGSASSRRTGRTISIVSAVLGLALLWLWPVFLFGMFVFPIVAALAAGRGARNGVFPGWIAIVFTVAAFSLLGGIGVDMNNGKDQTLVLLVAVGAPALLLGWFAFRGRPASVLPQPLEEPA